MGNVPVVGVIQHGGKVVATPVTSTDGRTLTRIVARSVRRGATAHTDEFRGYSTLHRAFSHAWVKHGARQYVDPGQPYRALQHHRILCIDCVPLYLYWVSC